MSVEICTVGGYSEVGKNMTAVKVNNDVVILDMGLHLEKYIQYKGDEDVRKLTSSELQRVDAIPDDSAIRDWKKLVKLIVPTHAHLDHVGAIPFMSNKYNAPIVCTPYTAEVIKSIVNLLYDLKEFEIRLKHYENAKSLREQRSGSTKIGSRGPLV